MSEVKTRLLAYLKSKRIPQLEFTKNIGVSSTYIGAMRRSIPDEKIVRIREAYPDLNTDWLLYGEGEMLNEKSPAGACEGEMIPLLPVEAHAGCLQELSRGVMPAECQMIVSPVKGVDYAIKISGDSMEPRFHDGSTVLIKRINEKAFIPWGASMVIDSENGVLVKEVYPDDKRKHYIEARSINPKYPPLSIPKSSVFGLYRILGVLQLFPTL